MRAVEFYSGIGGLHYAFLKSCPTGTVVAAYDVNDAANEVYRHNFGVSPLAVDIGLLKTEELEAWGADVWLASPPCQPYTRRGLNLQSSDARATSFMSLMTKLPEMKLPPKYILVENVVGFETSDTRDALLKVLNKCRYTVREYIISPCHLGFPYSRPRYFALAAQSLHSLSSSLPSCQPGVRVGSPLLGSPVLGPECNDDTGDKLHSVPRPTLGHIISLSQNSSGQLFLSDAQIKKYAWCLDIVEPSSTRVNCITKSYGHFLKGSGSILATANTSSVKDILSRYPIGSNQQGQTEALVEELRKLKLRFFSPAEIAALHSFPSQFSFPQSGITARRAYSLLGNSLHVDVVAHLLSYLMSPLFVM